MSQYYQQPDKYQQPQADFPSPENQQPVGNLSSQSNQWPPTGEFPPNQGGYPPAYQQPTGNVPLAPGGYSPSQGPGAAGSYRPVPGYPPPSNQGSSASPLMDSFQQFLRTFRSKGGAWQPSTVIPGTRPFGVTVAAIAVAIIGGLNLFIVLLLLGLLSFMSYLLPSPGVLAVQTAEAPGYTLFILVILYYTVLGIGHIYIARGLWQLRSWAYWSVITIEGLTIITQLVTLLFSHNGAAFFANIYIPLLIAGYLLVAEGVRKTFRIPF